ncbi:hypothetical protein EIN_320830 [Entamoeba invadens IP1]|uniref:SPRY domain-containing protein n=1 Tax=Entamoeba invadens IP1 TaxID=370355 RepID=A0A0A1UGV7_ENTIV|nr:hypothetical protein EIN_320830 [Entamoeba invadens IP1]ELP93720.1 hypothetical protein EIN_320830 [Entamoeba invadens IP1]|eukprot:XP_004260491.1 hypothetical protein EIN_320830 [Entamoeba invadens IP1]
MFNYFFIVFLFFFLLLSKYIFFKKVFFPIYSQIVKRDKYFSVKTVIFFTLRQWFYTYAATIVLIVYKGLCFFTIKNKKRLFGTLNFLNIQTFNLNGVDKGRFCIKAPHLKTIFIENSMEVIFDKMCEFQQLEVVQVCKSCTIKFKTNCTTKVKRIICSEATSTSIHMEIPEVQNVSISQCTTLKISKLKLEKLNTEIYIRNSNVKFDGFESKIDKIEFYYSENKNDVFRNDCNEFCGLSKFVPMSLGSVVTKNIITQSEYHKDLDYEMLISSYFWDKMGYTQNISYINSTGKYENYNSNDLKYFEISVEGLSCVSLGVVSSTYYLFKYLMVGWGTPSIGMDSSDGSFYYNGNEIENEEQVTFGLVLGKVDIAGCGFIKSTNEVFFTVNGKLIKKSKNRLFGFVCCYLIQTNKSNYGQLRQRTIYLQFVVFEYKSKLI